MAKHRFNQKAQGRTTDRGEQTDREKFQAQIKELLQQRKYRQALEEIKKIRRSIPEVEFSPSEGTIWLLRGQHEFQQNDFKQAESSLRRALELGSSGEVHYWLAKSLLELNRLDAALDLLRTAFEQETLPKDYSICYVKLLLLKEDTAAVEQLIAQKAKRFSAAQLHWVRGVLDLENGQPEAALSSFQKIKRPVTPEDVPTVWVAYTQQALGNWEAAAENLGMGKFIKQLPLNHPTLQRLVLLQQVKTEKPLLPASLRGTDRVDQEVVLLLEMLRLIDRGDLHEAGHVFLKLGHRHARFPELATLRHPLLILAGQQALEQRQPMCAEVLWQPIMAEQPFNPQLAVNLLEVLEANDSDQERQRLLTRLLKWLEQEAKQHPQEWPDTKLKPTLAKAHCLLADAWMALDRLRAGLGALQQAERLCPESPEVLGRRGLVMAMEEKYREATVLLTQGLEGGCRYEEVYISLLNCWRELEDKQALNDARRRFGKYFGDVNIEPEIEVLPWIDALSTQSYPFFSRLIQAEECQDPALDACRIFVDNVRGFPNSGGRVSLQQEEAVQQWEVLLQGLAAKEQIPVLQAIALSLQLFAKREKGIAGLITHYIQQLFLLSGHPEAKEAHLVVLAVKETQPQKIQTPLQQYLGTKPQPGTALANIQLQVRRFTKAKILASFIDGALRREPQNPILLLAKATTYSADSKSYEEFRQQGFEVARRLQDAKALQAFREEQAFLNACQAQEILPDPDDFDNLDGADFEDVIENTIRRIFGKQIPPNELERMMPELKQRLLESMPDFDDSEEEDFGFASSPRRAKKRKRSFLDL